MPEPLRRRDRLLTWGASWIGWMALQCIGKTSRLNCHYHPGVKELFGSGKSFIYALWHRFQFLMVYVHRQEGVRALVSRSRDGELIAQTIHRFGFVTIRGSSSRGGGAALLEAIGRLRGGERVCFTPDGPRGPLRSVQPGVVAAARKTGLPIVPVAWAGTKVRELSSWDRFLVPYPFARYEIVYHDILRISPDDSAPEEKVRNALNAAETEARERLESGLSAKPSP